MYCIRIAYVCTMYWSVVYTVFLTFVILIGFCTVSMFICLCIVFCFMWTPERLATTAVEANADLNKEKKKSRWRTLHIFINHFHSLFTHHLFTGCFSPALLSFSTKQALKRVPVQVCIRLTNLTVPGNYIRCGCLFNTNDIFLAKNIKDFIFVEPTKSQFNMTLQEYYLKSQPESGILSWDILKRKYDNELYHEIKNFNLWQGTRFVSEC